MKRSISEISESIHIDSRVVNQSTEYLYGGIHGSIMDGSPVGLITVINIDRSGCIFLLEDAQKINGIIFDNRLQELLMYFIYFFPIVFPEWF